MAMAPGAIRRAAAPASFTSMPAPAIAGAGDAGAGSRAGRPGRRCRAPVMRGPGRRPVAPPAPPAPPRRSPLLASAPAPGAAHRRPRAAPAPHTELALAEAPIANGDVISALEQVLFTGASDLHVTANSMPMLRVDGRLRPVPGAGMWNQDEVTVAVRGLMTEEQQETFDKNHELDFAYALPGGTRFRVNCYQQRGATGAAFRIISTTIRSLEELGVPDVVAQFATLPRGLVLVTGPTGSGKSTTLAALIDLVNRTRFDHIVTVEDPIEYVHAQQALADQPARGRQRHAQLQRRAQARAAAGPRRDPGRRDARPGDHLGRPDRRRDRPPGLRDPAHAGSRRRPSTASSTSTRRTSRTRSARSSRRPCRASCRRPWCRARPARGRVIADRGADHHARHLEPDPRGQGPPDHLEHAGRSRARHAHHGPAPRRPRQRG